MADRLLVGVIELMMIIIVVAVESSATRENFIARG